MFRIRRITIASTAILATMAVTPEASAQHDHSHSMGRPDHAGTLSDAPPRELGQAAFAALSEVVAILEADPATDWERVDVGALRDHLVDMERLTVDAEVVERRIDGGLEIVVGGPPSAVEAARRMVPPHVAMVAAGSGWRVETEDRGTDLRVLWTTREAAEVPKLRALGFFGLMATGGHHQHHHLMIATGRDPH